MPLATGIRCFTGYPLSSGQEEGERPPRSSRHLAAAIGAAAAGVDAALHVAVPLVVVGATCR
ncbi:hypothetical protein [Rhizobium sp. CF122]|uniref:hypothetical protein n=1 Tax=Rhizobium sp. CF122 TaxID=1144312 RepID=UPI0002E7B8E5